MRVQSILIAALAAVALPGCGDSNANIPEHLNFLGKTTGYASELKLVFLAPDKKHWPADNYREARVLEDFEFVDGAGRSWKVPAGYVTDGASIPYGAWSSGIGPYDGPYRDAAVLHDYYCEHKGLGRSWQAVQDMFLEASKSRGTSELTAKVLYTGVLFGGMIGYCTWDETVPSNAGTSDRKADAAGVSVLRLVGYQQAKDAPPPLSAEDQKLLKELQAWILKENPSYEAIRKRIDELKTRKAGQST